jgi:Rab proteins geranylgeranyltransferase component A
LSLQEAEAWVKDIDKDGVHSTFSDASITVTPTGTSEPSQTLGFSRAYSLALAPQLIYTQSKLLPYLVSSKVYRQLEFLAMGSWWVFSPTSSDEHGASEEDGNIPAAAGKLMRIPTTREDVVFSDKSIDLRSKRAVMKILRFVMDYENQHELWEPYSSKPFSDFLTEQFKLPRTLHDLFLALTLSLEPPQNTYTSSALPRIARHLRSTGKLGPGFSSVIPKWGGLSEIAQIACRAGAVGGAVYVLGKGLKQVGKKEKRRADQEVSLPIETSTDIEGSKTGTFQLVHLDGNEAVRTEWIASSMTPQSSDSLGSATATTISRSISIVSSPLLCLFPSVVENSPPPSGAALFFPSGSLDVSNDSAIEVPPVYLIIHSSDTGECPNGQSKSRLILPFHPIA